jgi:hypothetical protein
VICAHPGQAEADHQVQPATSGHNSRTFGVFKMDQQLKHLKRAARE